MTNTPDDLAGLFAADPVRPAQEVRFRQGTIRAFNQDTWENVVEVGGGRMTNLPLLGMGEASLLVPDAKVGIMVIGDSTQTMYIQGRIVEPGTPDQRSAAALLNSQIYAKFVTSPAGDTATSTAYGDLATFGPQVDVPVGLSGRILVIATAQIQWATAFADPVAGDGRFDVAFSGANTRVPNETTDPLVGVMSIGTAVVSTQNSTIVVASMTASAVFEGLNPGMTSIVMKYRKGATSTTNPNFFRRNLIVIKL